MTLHMELWRMWSNGSRSLLIALLIFLAAALGFGIMTLAVVFYRPSEYKPLHNENPQTVENTTVVQGTFVVVTGTKCVRGDEAVALDSRSHFINVNDRTKIVTYLVVDGAVRQPGCLTRTFMNPLPPEVTPGRWIIEGEEIARKGTSVQTEPWFTEVFTVVPEER